MARKQSADLGQLSLPKFRVNPLIAVVQPGKVRPVLAVSSPKHETHNSVVDETRNRDSENGLCLPFQSSDFRLRCYRNHAGTGTLQSQTFSKHPNGVNCTVCAGVQAIRTHSDRMARQGHLSIATQGKKICSFMCFFP
jgi:hypothetical protein